MAKLYNLARMTTATTGTGTITLGSAVSGFLTFAGAGVATGESVTYAIEDGSSREVGYGTYTSVGTTLTRNVITSTNSNAAISLSGSAQVFITPMATDLKADYGTALPTSPYDTQEAILVDSTTAPTYQWRFRYNAGSSSSYKWEFIGGSSIAAQAQGSTTSASYVVIATVTVPRAGDYLVRANVFASNSGSGDADPQVRVNSVAQATSTAGGRLARALMYEKVVTGITASYAVDVTTKSQGSDTTTYSCSVSITPVRVS